jgi:hypothetical protein
MYGDDNSHISAEEVIDVDVGDADPSADLLDDEMEYLTYLHDGDGVPMVKKLLPLHPFERVVRLEERKGFFQRLLELLKN